MMYKSSTIISTLFFNMTSHQNKCTHAQADFQCGYDNVITGP